MRTLSEYNKEQLYAYSKKANLLCDICGAEMIYTDKYLLLSYPPKRNVHCVNCGYKGYKIEG